MVDIPRILVIPLLIAAIAACGGEQPSLTPSSVATSTSPPASIPAPALLSTSETCNLMETPYDVLVIATAAEVGEERAEIRHSGSDQHILSTYFDMDGVLIGKSEVIIKDRTRYYRESTKDNPDVYGNWRITQTNVPRSPPPPCLDPSRFDESASSSSDEPHLTREIFLSEEEGAMRGEYWADSAGRPVRERRTFFPPEYDGVTHTDTAVMEFTYSGYGEPNIITAPCDPAGPEHTDNTELMQDCLNLWN